LFSAGTTVRKVLPVSVWQSVQWQISTFCLRIDLRLIGDGAAMADAVDFHGRVSLLGVARL
jgi:hypothetical protein